MAGKLLFLGGSRLLVSQFCKVIIGGGAVVKIVDKYRLTGYRWILLHEYLVERRNFSTVCRVDEYSGTRVIALGGCAQYFVPWQVTTGRILWRRICNGLLDVFSM